MRVCRGEGVGGAAGKVCEEVVVVVMVAGMEVDDSKKSTCVTYMQMPSHVRYIYMQSEYHTMLAKVSFE